MTLVDRNPLLAFFNPGPRVDPALAQAAREHGFRIILDAWGRDPAGIAASLGKAGAGDLRLTADMLLDPGPGIAEAIATAQTLWIDCHPLWVDDFSALETALSELARGKEVIPVLSTPDSVSALVGPGRPFGLVALKGQEGAGPVGLESGSLLFAHFQARARGQDSPPQALIFGGAVRPESVAAYLACGARGVVFESLALAFDLEDADPRLRKSLAALRPEQTRIVGQEIGLPLRVFDKGISRAVAGLGRELAALKPSGENPTARAARALLAPDMNRPELGPWSDRVVFLGPEASFCAAFAQRFGTDPGEALGRFWDEIQRAWELAPQTWSRFLQSPLRREFGLEYPFVQGAMAWISDNPGFARAVSRAGGLPTLSLGLRTRPDLEAALSGLRGELEGAAFAVNLLALAENKTLEEQLAWIEETRPDLVVVAGFTAPLIRRLGAGGLRTACLTVDRAGMVAALEAGADHLILEGNEAGGHVGPLSTQTLAQIALDLDDQRPDLAVGTRIILAGGVFDRATAFRAAMLGARGVQMGTAYLTTEEIVSSGALSPLYQRMIAEAGFGATVTTGESLGLSVRALRTKKIQELQELEQEIRSTGMEESLARARVEEKVMGSLLVAARSRREPGGEPLAPEVCQSQGQFLAGAGAGALSRIRSLARLHLDLAQGPFEPVPPPARTVRPSPGQTAWSRSARPAPEGRIAITGMAISNALGHSVDEVWEGSAAMKSGIIQVPSSRWDHQALFDPDPRAPGKTYCPWGAFQSLDISRKELGLSPQDFRTMSASTRLTLWLADRVLKDSGLLGSGHAPERIGVVVAQNSGEAPDRLREVFLHLEAGRIAEELGRMATLSPNQAQGFRRRLEELGLAIDDTTLLGRLNCAAGGFISNKYGLRGPCFAVTAACAGSLAALYSAVQMIRGGVIDAALVGGGEELLTPAHFLEFSALGALAGFSGARRDPSAASRPLDRLRDGMVLGEGGAMIVIERESKARQRKAGVKALITSVGASNNDQGMVESSAATQRLALGAALSGLDHGPEELDLIECHATGTSQGDAQEIKALKSILERRKRGPVLAAFKSQIGHTLGASGLNGLIRAATAMDKGVFPGTLNYEQPDPDISLEEWGLRVLDRPEEWPRSGGGPRRAMVNAFGFGGANYVVVLEEDQGGPAPARARTARRAVPPPSPPAGVSVFRVSSGPFGSGRKEARVAVLADDQDQAQEMIREAGERLLSADPEQERDLARAGIFCGPAGADSAGPGPAPLALVVAGQGTFYQGMGRELYDSVEPIRKTMDRIATLADYDLLGLLFQGQEEKLRQTRWQQPALFTLEYALGRYIMDLGVTPKALAGHSLGELTALCLAGVYSLEAGFALVEKRARCMARAAGRMDDPGAMLALDPTAPGAQGIIGSAPGVFRSNFNSPCQTVLGGATRAVQELKEKLARENIRSIMLRVSMAFHSPLMKVIREEMAGFLDQMELRPPRIPVLSNTTGRPYPDDPEGIREIILAHEESPVKWLSNVEYLGQELGIGRFVEIGPRDTLSGFIRDTLEGAECFQVCRPGKELRTLSATLARLFCLGLWEPRGGIARIDLSKPGAQPGPTAAKPGPGSETEQEEPLGSDVLEEVIRIIMEATGYDRDEIEPEMDLRQNLAIRSSRLPVIIDAVEQTFGVIVEWDDFVDVRTVRDLAQRVARIAGQEGRAKPRPKLRPEPDLSPGGPDPREDPSGPIENATQPPLRLLLCRTRVADLGAEPIDLPRGKTVVVLARAEDELVARLRDHLQKTRKLKVLVIDPDGPEYGLASPSGAGRAAAALAQVEDAVGLIMLPGRAGADQPSALLRGWFVLLKEFLARPAKRFCLALEVGAGPGLVGDGLAGMLLTAALEYRSVLFRSLVLEPGLDPGPAFDIALTEGGPVRLGLEAGGVFAERLEAGPACLDPEARLNLREGEVVVVSGGGRGISGRLASALAPYRPRLILLGRSAPDGPAQGPEIQETLAVLKKAGLEASYLSCDVTSAGQVEEALARVHQEQGPIVGLIHGAGRLRDAFARFLSADDFDRVVRVKLDGAANLLASARGRGLRFAVGFSSLVTVQGNPGQTAYCCANLAMAALLQEFGRDNPGVGVKVLLLPPVAGAGMAEDPETRKLMELKGLGRAYVDLEELRALFGRELCRAGFGRTSVGWARDLPRAGTALLDLSPPAPKPGFLDCAEMRFPARGWPLVRRVERMDLGPGVLWAGSVLSAGQDLWLEDHKPFTFVEKPLFSGIMAVETFIEAARLIHPGLTAQEVRGIEYQAVLECPPETEQRIAIRARSGPLSAAGAEVGVEIGRAGEVNFSGRVILGPEPSPESGPDGFSLIRKEELDTETIPPPQIAELYQAQSRFGPRYRVIERIVGTGPGLIQGLMYYPDSRDFAEPESVAYQYPLYLLEGLTQLMGFYPFLRQEVDRVDMMPLGVRRLTLIRGCGPGQRLDLQARLRRGSGPVLTWDGLGLDQEGRAVLLVQGFSLRRFGS